VHDDVRAGESARELNASAYTVGRHIVFAPGRFAPADPQGRRLLAHELAHVVQQERVADQPFDDLSLGAPHDALEQQADRAADLVSAGMHASQGPDSPAAPVIQRDACGPDVTAQIKNTWERVQADFRTWKPDDKKKACDYLLEPRVPVNPDDKSWFPKKQWNVDAFDTLPLFHKAARFWLMHDRVTGAGCCVPVAPSKTDAKVYEHSDYCSVSVQVKDQCWRSGTVNYGTYGVMCKLCADFGVDYIGIYNWATLAMYAYKLRIFSEKATTEEEDISIPHSWFKATYEGGPGAVPSGAGNKSKKCPCTCTLTGSIVKWDYVWEPIKRRTAATGPGEPDLSQSGVAPTPVPAPPPGRS
jgi:hypothetical protein